MVKEISRAQITDCLLKYGMELDLDLFSKLEVKPSKSFEQGNNKI
jgi:hypothetical protein